MGGVALLAMSTVASILVPSEITKNTKVDDNIVDQRAIADKKRVGLLQARGLANRMLLWGLVLGGILGSLQIACLPLLNMFSPLPDVQSAAKLPSVIGACLQLMNGVVFIGEGSTSFFFSQITINILIHFFSIWKVFNKEISTLLH